MIDIGANLTNQRFSGELDELLSRAHHSGVESIIVTGTDLDSSTAALALSQTYQSLYCTAGVHPHDASSYSDEVEHALTNLLTQPKVVAVGETGLDFNRNFSSPEAQVEAFSRQLALAAEVGKPLFLHERDAFDTQFAMLKKHRANFSEAVIHCFTGSHQDLRAYLSLGMYIGVTGWVCDERRGAQLQDAVKFIPDDKLLIETDTPYLTPRTLPNRLRKRKNEPANLGHIASTIAALRGQSVEHIREMTMSNSKRFFALN